MRGSIGFDVLMACVVAPPPDGIFPFWGGAAGPTTVF